MVGGYLWVTGSDNLIAGVNQIISGAPTKTVGANILESIGVPAEYSELVYSGFDVATGMTSVVFRSSKTGEMRQILLAKNGKTTQIVGNVLKDFATSKQGSIKIPGTGAGKGTTGTSVIAQGESGLVGSKVIQPNTTVKLTENTQLPNGEVIPKGSTVTVSDNTMKVTYPDGTSKISSYDKAISSPSALPDLTNVGKGTNATQIIIDKNKFVTPDLPGVAQSRVNVANVTYDNGKIRGFEYAMGKHGANSSVPNKSRFLIGNDEVKTLLQRPDIVNKPVYNPIQIGGKVETNKFVRQVDVGKPIGFEQSGNKTSVITIITDRKGNLINTFPGKL